jgi:hypothetical protein
LRNTSIAHHYKQHGVLCEFCSICVDNSGKNFVNFGQISLFVLNLC